MKKVKQLLVKYKDIILYGIFGVLSTVVNIVSYWAFAHPFGIGTMLSTVLAWFLTVSFVYLTNRKWVFHSSASTMKEYLREIIAFFSCRIATGVLDWACMFCICYPAVLPRCDDQSSGKYPCYHTELYCKQTDYF